MDSYADEECEEGVAAVLEKYALVMVREEMRSGFLSKEGYKIMKIKESFKKSGGCGGGGSGNGNGLRRNKKIE